MQKTRDQRSEIRDQNFYILTIIVFFILTFFHSQLPALSNDYDSLIGQVSEKARGSKRLSRLIYRHGITRFQKVKNNLYVIPLNETKDEAEKLAKISELKESGIFELVEPNYKLSLDQITPERNYIKVTNSQNYEPPVPVIDASLSETIPNDRDFSSQYYLREINATKAWNTTVGKALLVGILDTGVDANHPDLLGKVKGGLNTGELDLTDDIGHGTEVAGIIAANTNNYQGIAGIAWNTTIFSKRVTDEIGQARVSTVVSALDEAYNQGVKIVQISLSTNQFSQTLKNAVKEAQERGILIISTGGNTGVEELRYPAAFNGVIGVGAVDQSKEIESYSTTGEHITLVAPGAYIYTTSTGSTYIEASGTSFSAPQVAGAAALVWSITPDLSNEEVREILIQSTEDLGKKGKDYEYGYGLLNIQRAVEIAKAKLEQNGTDNAEIKSWINK